MKRGIEAITAQGIDITGVDRSVYKKGTCLDTTKARFSTEEDAKRAVKNTQRKYGHPMRAYPCGRHWHITSQMRGTDS